jgi:hypothetical protein
VCGFGEIAVAALRIARFSRILLRWQRVTNRGRETVEFYPGSGDTDK